MTRVSLPIAQRSWASITLLARSRRTSRPYWPWMSDSATMRGTAGSTETEGAVGAATCTVCAYPQRGATSVSAAPMASVRDSTLSAQIHLACSWLPWRNT
ncbi:hypothetical protein G6F56_014260 [Rhizopus delemar]|nr:hypothetical protein G6F56_014260 [Rhizopus delemar]